MPTRQVEENDWLWLQQRAQVADVADQLYNDPQWGKEAKRILKGKFPQLQIPDYDIEKKFEDQLEAVKREQEEEKRKAKEAADAEEYRQKRQKTQKDYGFTEDAMTKLEQLMVDKNIGDYEVAATYMASKEPKASEPTYDSYRWNHHKQEGFAEIAKDPEAWGRAEILKALHTDSERARNGR